MFAIPYLRDLISDSLYKKAALFVSKANITPIKIAAQDAKFEIESSSREHVSIGWFEDTDDWGVIGVRCTCYDFYADDEDVDFCAHAVAGLIFLATQNENFQRMSRRCEVYDFLAYTEIGQAISQHSSQMSQTPVTSVFRDNTTRYPHESRSFVRPERDLQTERFMKIFAVAQPSRHQNSCLVNETRSSIITPVEIWYELCANNMCSSQPFVVKLKQRSINHSSGKISAKKNFDCPVEAKKFNLIKFTHEEDAIILGRITALRMAAEQYHLYSYHDKDSFRALHFESGWALTELTEVARTGRCYLANAGDLNRKKGHTGKSTPITLDACDLGDTLDWYFVVREDERHGLFAMSCELRSKRGSVVKLGEIFCTDRLSTLVTTGGFLRKISSLPYNLRYIVESISQNGPIIADKEQTRLLTKAIRSTSGFHVVIGPAEVIPEVSTGTFLPRLSILRTPLDLAPDYCHLNISMVYGSHYFDIDNEVTTWIDVVDGEDRHYTRDIESERSTLSTLVNLAPCIHVQQGHNGRLAYHAKASRPEILEVVQKAVDAGWRVDFEGKSVKVASEFKIGVSSGIDWFNLQCEAKFNGETLRGMQLLKSSQNSSGFITLADGSLGLIKDQQFQRNLAHLSRLVRDTTKGTSEETIRISKFQSLLLELEDLRAENTTIDDAAQSFFQNIKSHKVIKPLATPDNFMGTLRPYQLDGLSWLDYLQQTGFGGILADDMGLGKTVQVIAHLVRRYEQMKQANLRLPTVILAPKSVLYNWQLELKRFAPCLSVELMSSGAELNSILNRLHTIDVLVASYQMARNELASLEKIEFDYIILDEAHMIKNRDAQISRSVKIFKSRHRLALTGTPIENSIENLASIFEFLNPSLGASNLFVNSKKGITAATEDLKLIANAIRPFLLRRTKQQVLSDLPPKTESIVYCDLSDQERHHYDSISMAVRENLAKKIKEDGIKKSQIHILAALTRLRQAASHIGLIDKGSKGKPSTKFTVMLERIQELSLEGEKSLVFSQFTEHLKLAKDVLESNGVMCCYLDGQTTNREKVIEEFNTNPKIKVFLLSLKAGGVGLNLTSATNCFILDPWWNPAAENQAIDRTYRIGQKKPVFAYRLIARRTVEEKILQLQNFKSELASTVLAGNEGTPRPFTQADLALLLQ